jgi:hypothetical protein
MLHIKLSNTRPLSFSLVLLVGTVVSFLVSCVTLSRFPASFPPESVAFLGAATVPGGSKAKPDMSGLPHTLLEDGKSYQDSFDGFGSGFAYTGFGNRYYALADRGPNKIQYKDGKKVDYTTTYPNRYQILDVVVRKAGQDWTVQADLAGTTLLTDATGRNFLGISTAFTGTDPSKNLRLDPEGIRIAPDGTTWISDEYGPVIHHFDNKGRLLGSLKVPENLMIEGPAATLAEEIAANQRGRYTNKGAEGLALSPDGKTLVVVLQNATIQDGGPKALTCRILVYNLSFPEKAPRQLVYICDSLKTGISEILAVNGHQFLIDERDGTTGAQGNKKLYFIDIDQEPRPSDVAAVEKLPLDGQADSIVPLKKVLFADIGALLNSARPFTTAAGLPDKIEGYAFGPDLPDGRHLLLATNDNDYSDNFPNYIFAFAIDSKALPGFRPFRLNRGVKIQ